MIKLNTAFLRTVNGILKIVESVSSKANTKMQASFCDFSGLYLGSASHHKIWRPQSLSPSLWHCEQQFFLSRNNCWLLNHPPGCSCHLSSRRKCQHSRACYQLAWRCPLSDPGRIGAFPQYKYTHTLFYDTSFKQGVNENCVDGSLFAVGMFSVVTGLLFLADLAWLLKTTKFTFSSR